MEFDCIQYRQTGHHTFSALPPIGIPNASPKAISRRTSYLPTRLEFLPYPQVIRGRFNERRFGPPVGFTPPSTCSWIDRRASGLCLRTKSPYSGSLSLRLRLYDLTSHANITRRFTYSFRFFSLPSRGSFHLSLTVLVHYRSLVSI